MLVESTGYPALPFLMRLSIFTLFVLILISSCSPKTASVATKAPAPASLPAMAPAAAPGLEDTTLLWKITTPGAPAPSYLFGTIHIIPEEDYFLPNRVVKALNDAEEVVFEIDPRDMENPAVMMSLITKLNMKGGAKLKDLLTDEQYTTVKEYFADSPLPFMFLERLKPLFVSAMVGQDAGSMGEGGLPGMGGLGGGMDGMKSYELELTKIAEAADKTIGGLETIDFQLSLFDSIPYTEQAVMLYEAIQADNNSEAGTGESQLDQMIDMYRRQAVAEMATMISDESAGSASFEELLLTKRNQKWVPVIAGATKAKTVFYAVGAGHLGGDKGVISLLRAEGISVEPVF